MSDPYEILLGRVFDDHLGDLRDAVKPEDYETLRRDFVFHMTDWRNDLEKLQALSRHPRTFSTEQATAEVIGILYHIIPHLKAAGRILLGEVPDAFEHDETAQLLARTGWDEKPAPTR